MRKSFKVLQQTKACLVGTRKNRSNPRTDRSTFTLTRPASMEDIQFSSAAKETKLAKKKKDEMRSTAKKAPAVMKVPEISDSFRKRMKHLKGGTVHLYLTSGCERYGPMCALNVPGRKIVALGTPQTVKAAFLGEKHNTNGRIAPYFQEGVFENFGFAFSDLSKLGGKQKSILMKYLHRVLVPGELVVCRQTERLANSIVNKDGVDMTDRFKDFLTDYFGTLLTGETLPEGSPDRDALWELIDLLYAMLDPAVDAPLRLFPFLRFLPTKHGRLYKNTIKARDRVAKIYFESQKATFEEGRTRGLVDVCLQMQADDVREKGSSWLSDDYIRGLMYDTTLAGMTEMMKSLRMLILLMCHHPDVQSRVYTEIADVIGSDTTPTSDHRARMPYTQAVVMEMLRYVSQTPLAIPHKCNKDVVLDGYLVEKDSGIVPNLWGIHHNEEVWGDPWTFRPDRFLDPATGNLIPADSATMKSFLPFSIGKRRCPGENFAMSRIFLIFSSLLQRLTFLPPDGEPLPSVDPRLYNNKFPLTLPVYTCKVLPRDHTQTS